MGIISREIIEPDLALNYYDNVYEFVKVNVSKDITNDSRILIVGHSLGGGIAQIVAAKVYDDDNIINSELVTSFGLSSPGTAYSSRKFGIQIADLDATSVSLLPRRDPVPLV